MSDVSSLLQSFAGQGNLVDQKKVEVASVSDQLKSTFAPPAPVPGAAPAPNYYGIAAGAETGRGNRGLSEQDSDIRNLSTVEMYLKYGPAAANMITARVNGRNAYMNDRTATRTLPEMAEDTVAGVVSGAVNSVGGIGALGAGLVNAEAGAWASGKLAKFNADTRRSMSAGAQANLRADEAVLEQATRDNQDRYDTEVKTDGELIASLRQIGRNFGDQMTVASESPTSFIDGTAQGVGSMLTGGVLSGGVKAVGRGILARAAAIAGPGRVAAVAVGAPGVFTAGEKIAEYAGKAALPGVIGAMEGGGAYVGTVQEILTKTPEELMSGSVEYRTLRDQGMSHEEARTQVANRAGLIAGAIQAPIGAATGLLVSKFEGAPFRVGSATSVAGNALREAVEEGIQSGSGQLAQNQAIRSTADKDQSLAEGVGEQIAAGALYGMGTTGAVQGPGLALQSAVKGAGFAVRGVVGLGMSAVNGLMSRADNAMAQAEAQSPVAAEKVTAAQTAAAQAAASPEVIQEVEAAIQEFAKTPEDALAGLDHVRNLFERSKFDPAEAEQEIPAIGSKIADSTDRFDAIRRVSEMVTDGQADEKTQVAAGLYLLEQMEKYGSVVERDLVKAIEEIPEEHPAYQQLTAYEDVVLNLTSHPQIRAAMAKAHAMKNTIAPEDVSEEAIATPEGQQAAMQAVRMAEQLPDKADAAVNDQIVAHAYSGKLVLTPVQIAAVEASNALIKTQERVAALAEKMGRTKSVSDMVSAQIKSDKDTGIPYVSATEHTLRVIRAMRAGRTDIAQDALQEFADFAQHMQNKVDALNQDYQSGTGSKSNPRSFDAVDPITREWFKAQTYLDPKSTASVINAQNVYADAQIVGEMVNNLTKRMVDLDVKPVAMVTLDQALQQPAKMVVRSNRTRGRAAPATSAPVATPTQSSTPVAQPAAPVQAKVEPVAEVAPTKTPDPVEVVEKVEEAAPKVEPTTELQAPAVKAETEEAATVQEETPETEAEIETKDETPFPNMIGKDGSGIKGYFNTAFKEPKTAISRLLGSKTPVELVSKSLKNGKLPANVAKAYGDYLGMAQTIVDSIQNRAGQYLTEVKTTKAGADYTRLQSLLVGADSPNYSDGKVLNLLEQVGEKLNFNQELVEGAALAGLQWLLTSEQRARPMDDEAVGKLLGIEAHMVKDAQIEFFNEGLPVAEAKSALGSMIARYWGVTPNRSVGQGFTVGIPEAVAAEVLKGLEAAGLIELSKEFPPQMVETGADIKEYNRIILKTEGKIGQQRELLQTTPDAIEQAVVTEPEKVTFIGEPPKTVPMYQMRNRLVKLGKRVREAIRAEQNTKHFVNVSMTGFLMALDDAGVLELFAEGDLETRQLNKNHRISLEGKNKTVSAAFKQLRVMMAQTEGKAAELGVEVSDVPIYYEYGMSRVGRLHMLGLHNPQSSKLMREAILPTQSTIDLSNPAHKELFMLAVAQAFGVKVHKIPRAKSAAKAQEYMSGGLAPAVEFMKQWMDNGDPLSSADINLIRDAIRVALDKPTAAVTPVMIHALMEYVRAESTTEAGQSQFKTALYVEADGVTDGPINAMVHFATGFFTPQWMKTVARGGLFINSLTETLNSFSAKDEGKLDLYAATSSVFQELLAKQTGKIKGMGKVGAQNAALSRVMSTLVPDFTLNDDGTVTVDRGLVKNPLTVTIYGSGDNGIAAKITGALLDAYYAKVSETMSALETMSSEEAIVSVFGSKEAADQFNADVKLLTTSVVEMDKGKFVHTEVLNSVPRQPLEDLTLNRDQVANLTTNMLNLFVSPMREAIKSQIGEVDVATDMMRKSIQAQSLYLKFAFQAAILRKMQEKKAADPNYKRADFLSDRELADIYADLKHLSPLIDTGDLSLFVGGSQRSEIVTERKDNGKKTLLEGFSRSFTADLTSPAMVYGPEDAGVAGIPFMTIAPGDGQMMVNAAVGEDATEGTLKVFDGMHMNLLVLEDGSIRLNKAVFDGWMGNPLADAAASFAAFVKDTNLDLSNQPEEMVQALLSTLFSFKERAVIKAEDAPKLITARLNEMSGNMTRLGQQAEARKMVLAQLPLSIDHMAGAESPYSHKGTVDLSGLDEAGVLAKMNELYAQALAKVQGVPAPVDNISEALNSLGSIHEGSGARVILTQELNAKNLNIQADQKDMLNRALRSLQGNGFTIVLGTEAQTAGYAQQNGLRQLQSEVTGQIMGYTVMGDRTIYLHNASAETLVHELIHAATLARVTAALEPTSNSVQEDRDAVQRLEGLMQEWLESEGSLVEMNERVRRSFFEARSAVLREANTPGRLSVTNRANALNEFMAWSLSNQELIRTQKRMTVKNRMLLILKDALASLKSLFVGGLKAPKTDDTVFANVRFNTAVLLTEQKSVAAQMNEVVVYQSMSYGTNDRLTQLMQAFNKKIELFINETVSSVRVADAAAMTVRAEQVAGSFSTHGFPMTPQERGAFVSIVAAYLIEADINPNANAALQEVYSYVTKNLTVEMFMADENSLDPRVRYVGQQKYNSLMGAYKLQYDDKGKSSLLPAFLALANTNDEFRAVLAKMKMPKKTLGKGVNLDTLLTNLGNAAVDRLGNLVSGSRASAPNVIAAVDVLTTVLAKNAQDQKNIIDQSSQTLSDIIETGNDFVVDKVQKSANKVIEIAENIKNSSNKKLVQNVAATVALAASVVSLDRSRDVAAGMMSMLNDEKIWKPFNEIMNELVGMTDENAGIYKLIKSVRSMVQQVRQKYREDLPVILAKQFSRELTPAEWSNLYKLGKFDMASLVTTTGGMANLLDMVSNSNSAQVEIARIEQRLSQSEGQRWPYLQRKSKELAVYLNTGKVSGNLLRNAYAVSALYGEPTALVGNAQPNAATVQDIDQLVSLYALEDLDKATRDSLASLAQTEADGVDFLVSYLVGQRADEVRKLNNSLARMNHYKGYMPSEAKYGLSLIVEEDTEYGRLITQGYRRLGNYEGSRAEFGASKKGYYFSPVAGQATFNQGIMQNVMPTVAGVNPMTGMTYNGAMIAGRITDPKMIRRIQRLRSNNDKATEPLMPVYGINGTVIAYERSVSPLEEARLNKNTHAGEMIGAWRGRQVEEAMAGKFNRTLIQRLRKMYAVDQAKGRAEREYVNLFDPAEQKKDPIMADAVKLFHTETLAQIEDLFGKGRFMVRRDMINDTIGYRSASIGDVWTGNTMMSPEVQAGIRKTLIGIFGIKAYQHLVTGEKVYQNLVSDARVLIVIKSVIVPVANMIANLHQLMLRNVPITTAAKGMITKTAEVNAYVKSRLREIEVEAELRAATNDVVKTRKLKTELQSIMDANRRLSIWPLIEAGEFSSISDGGITREDVALSEGRLNEYVENLVDKLPKPVRDAGRYAVISKDTALFKGLTLATQYGDFLGKSVYYDNLIKKGMSAEDALAKISEEFVNYDRLPGRTRSYLENSGLLWFWNFKLRIAKVAIGIIRENPLQALMMTVMPMPDVVASVGSPLTDNALSKALDGSLLNSVGLGQGLRSWHLHPWIQLTS